MLWFLRSGCPRAWGRAGHSLLRAFRESLGQDVVWRVPLPPRSRFPNGFVATERPKGSFEGDLCGQLPETQPAVGPPRSAALVAISHSGSLCPRVSSCPRQDLLQSARPLHHGGAARGALGLEQLRREPIRTPPRMATSSSRLSRPVIHPTLALALWSLGFGHARATLASAAHRCLVPSWPVLLPSSVAPGTSEDPQPLCQGGSGNGLRAWGLCSHQTHVTGRARKPEMVLWWSRII